MRVRLSFFGMLQERLSIGEKFELSPGASLGKLNVGETSILIAAAAHRAQDSEGCRWLVGSLKRTAPIWKKEHFQDGAAWADGEPVPPQPGEKEIVRP